MEKALAEHKSALDNANKELSRVSAAMDQRNKVDLPKANDLCAKTLEELNIVIAHKGYESVEAAIEVFTKAEISAESAEAWIDKQVSILNEYSNDVKNTKARIEELTIKTSGKELKDVNELNVDIDATHAEFSVANEAAKAAYSLIEKHTDLKKKITDANKKLETTTVKYKALEQLSDVACGTSEEGGKLSFDRYIMGAVFREILEMANKRLDLLTGGRYELIHNVSGNRKNAKAGLDINVLDNVTGKERSASSISGGESFLVSLALALGLSDVVQNHAGGVKMDSLFIDEGFGTLGDSKLDATISVLNNLSENGNRLVGIISHVEKLDGTIPQKIIVRSTESGSKLKIEV